MCRHPFPRRPNKVHLPFSHLPEQVWRCGCIKCNTESFDYISTVSGNLSSVVRAVYDLKQTQSKLEALCGKVLEQQAKTISEVRELKEMVAMQAKKNFSLKSSCYEVLMT